MSEEQSKQEDESDLTEAKLAYAIESGATSVLKILNDLKEKKPDELKKYKSNLPEIAEKTTQQLMSGLMGEMYGENSGTDILDMFADMATKQWGPNTGALVKTMKNRRADEAVGLVLDYGTEVLIQSLTDKEIGRYDISGKVVGLSFKTGLYIWRDVSKELAKYGIEKYLMNKETGEYPSVNKVITQVVGKLLYDQTIGRVVDKIKGIGSGIKGYFKRGES